VNESAKQAIHDIATTRLWEHEGQELYFDSKTETGVQPERSATPAPPAFTPDYAAATQLLVKDKRLRAALPKRVSETLELVFRKLAAGMDAKEIITSVADALNRSERTVRRHLATAREIATDISGSSSELLQTLRSLVISDRQ
jgi:DNA-binding NarL/FixJ family response regulator